MCLEQPADCVKQLATQYFGAGSDKVEWVSYLGVIEIFTVSGLSVHL